MQLNNRNHLFSLIIAGCYLACSSSDPNTPATTGTGGTLGAAGSTAGTTTIGNAGTASGGASAGGGGSGGVATLPNAGTNTGGADAGAGGVAAGAGGTAQGGSSGESAGGTAGAGGTVASTVPEGPFVCSQVLGLLSSGEWYNAGFEDALNEGEGDHWQGTFVHYGYVNIWADPMSYTWVGPTVSSNCTEGSDAPERLLFQAVSWELTDQAAWETQLEAALAVIISKFPSAIRIDLMPLIRCPDNGYCHDDDPPLDYQPGYNMDATKQDCHLPDFVDAAFEAVAANHPSLVKLTPKFEAHACAPNIDGIHLGPENGPVAIDIANYVKGQSAL